MALPVTLQAVYFVSQESGDPVFPLAIRPTFSHPPFGEFLAWWDVSGDHGPSVRVKSIDVSLGALDPKNPPDHIKIKSKDRGVLHLQRLTRELFDQHVRSRVVQGDRLVFGSDEELQQFYLK